MSRIVVFGSINLDVIIPVERLPMPGETLLGGDAVISPGGKGANQAHAARLARADVAMVGRVGDDGLAEPALALLAGAGVDLSHVGTSSRTTGCATIWSGPEGSSTIVVAPGANADVRADDVTDALLHPGAILLLQQEVPLGENARVIKRASSRGVTTILNAAPALMPPGGMLKDVDYLVVNEIELQMICKMRGLSGEGLPELLARQLGTVVVATYGTGGVLRTDGRSTLHIPAHRVEVVDTTGAGDTFVGVFAACLARGLDETRTLELANTAAALSCTQRGAQAAQPKWEEFAHR